MTSLSQWLKDKIHRKNTSLNFDAHIETQTENLLVTYLYKQTVVGQVASLFCALILFIGLNNLTEAHAILVGWFIYSLLIAFVRIGLSTYYSKQTAPERKIKFWQNVFVIGALAGGLGWGFAGSYLFSYASANQQTLIILIMAGITSGAVPILAANMSAAIAFLATSLLPLIVQLFFQQQTMVYSLFSITIITYFIYMLVLSLRSHRLLKQTIGLQFEKEALTRYLNETQEKLQISHSKLNQVETHDLLTGLANRKYFMLALNDAIKHAETTQKNFAILYLDLDNFKFVNDAYGYDVGDQLLKMVIKRVKDHLREPDLLARMGGDEMAILLENQTNTSHISQIAKQICDLLALPFNVNDYVINMSASIGVSVYPLDGVQPDVLIKKADKAMQYIKEHGHNNFHFNTSRSSL